MPCPIIFLRVNPVQESIRIPDNSLCDDDLYCNGEEYCDQTLGCQDGTEPDCDDSLSCTTDSCNENLDSCDHIPIDEDEDGYPVQFRGTKKKGPARRLPKSQRHHRTVLKKL